MLDVTFMGRPGRPLRVKSARRIEHDATWSTMKDDLVFVAVGILLMAAGAVIAWGMWG